jgi:uncharacterized membrane protein YkgB
MYNSTGNITTNKVSSLERFGEVLIRYSLVVVLLWVGMLKFTSYEAEAIKPLVENSPILSWVLGVMSIQTFSMVLGTIEILLGLLIASRPFSPKASALGSFGAIIMFLVTLTFLISTPGVWQPEYGFPYLSPMPGQFMAKDVLFLSVAIWTAGDALNASRLSNTNTIHKSQQ